MTADVRPDRKALLELDALLGRIQELAAAGDRARYDSDDEYGGCCTGCGPPSATRHIGSPSAVVPPRNIAPKTGMV